MKSFDLKIEVHNGQIQFNCTNDGFNVYELIGFLEVERQSLLEQAMHPVKFDRTCIKPDGTIMKIENKECKDAQ